MPALRMTPRPWIGLVVVLGYGAVLAGIQRLDGVPYTALGRNADTLFRGVGVPLVIGAVLLAVVATALGWWRPALSEEPLPPERRAVHRWTVVAPALLAGLVLANLAAVDWPRVPLAFLAASVLLLLVGFTEELAVRGLLITALRYRLGEGWTWFVSSAVFGALHLVNVLAGLPLPVAALQGANAFLFGTALYILRRTTGTLLTCMALHAAWDWSLFLLQQGRPTAAASILLLEPLVGILALVVVRWAIVGRRTAA